MRGSDMTAPRETEGRHARGAGRLDAVDGVLDHGAACGVGPHARGGMEEQVGRRLTAGDLRGGEDMVAEEAFELRQGQAQADALGMRGGGDASLPDRHAVQHGVDARHRPQ